MSRIPVAPPAGPAPLEESQQPPVPAVQTGVVLGRNAVVVTGEMRPLSEIAEELSLFMAEKVEQTRRLPRRVKPNSRRSDNAEIKQRIADIQKKQAIAGAPPRAARRSLKSEGKP